MQSTNTEHVVFEDNTLYRDRYRTALTGLLLMVLLSVVLTFLVAYENVVPQKRQYFATTTNGVTVPMHALDQPVITSPYLLQWASQATRAAFNLDFVNYQDQLNNSATYFTPNGADSFKSALKSSGLLGDITGKKLDMNAIVSGAPVILNRYVRGGRYTWVVQLPLLITFTSASATEHANMVATLKIQRVPVLDAPGGKQIADISLANG